MKVVAYYRISAEGKTKSRLGLDAQRQAVVLYAKAVEATVGKEYTEVESGKVADRRELAKAITQSRRTKATLVIAKLDRLSRNVPFLSALMEAGINFAACDNPHVSHITGHLVAAIAEEETWRASQRSKAALQAAKKRGTLLGSARPGHWRGREKARLNGLAKGRQRSVEIRSKRAREAIVDLLPEMKTHREAGKSLSAIAKELNSAGHQTVRGSIWTAMQVKRALDRMQQK